MKILVLGNSHGLDAARFVNAIYHREKPEEELVLGALYHSGATVQMYEDFLLNDRPKLGYYKNDGTNPEEQWVIQPEFVGKYAILDEKWDIVILQHQNQLTGLDSSYNKNSWLTVHKYVEDLLGYKPRWIWNMLWVNPDTYELYVGEDAPLAHPRAADYKLRYERDFPGPDGKYSHRVLYDLINEKTQKYIVDTTEFLGENVYEMLLPAASAIEYALDVLKRPDPEIFRDWTHLNDYGRLIAGYVWYCKLEGIERLEDIQLDEIPAAQHRAASCYPDPENLKLTEKMKQDLLQCVNWALKHPFSCPTE